MEAVEIIGLERSRENWRMIAVTLMLVVSAVLISYISYVVGKSNAIKYISNSGYAITKVYTPTNCYYTVESVK